MTAHTSIIRWETQIPPAQEMLECFGFERPNMVPHSETVVLAEQYVKADDVGPLRVLLRSLPSFERTQFLREPCTVMHLAAHCGSVAAVVLLAGELGFPLRPEMAGNGRALHIAAARGHRNIVRYLLTFDPGEVGCNTPAVTTTRRAIHEAAIGGHTEVVHDLVDAGEEPDAPDAKQWRSPFLWAVTCGHYDTAVSIVERCKNDNIDIDVNRADKDQLSAVHYLLRDGRGDIVEKLAPHGLRGSSPLCYLDALQYIANSPAVDDESAVAAAEIVVRLGIVDPSARMPSQLTAWHLAEKKNKSKLAAYLKPLSGLTDGVHLPPNPTLATT